MENITYVTGNYGKYISVKEKFEKEGININYADIDINELEENDIGKISMDKAYQAYEQIGSPVFAIDCGFYIRSFPEKPFYPGAFVKRSGISSDIEGLLNVMANEEDRYCFFLDCLTYYDGNDFVQFWGKSEGTLAYKIKGNYLKKAKSNLWYVFTPRNCSKTLAEMTDEERSTRNDGRVDALEKFITYLKSLGLESGVSR